ncbi:hypothetical protein [Sphingobacterium humi]|uniref:Uncharacterized protein n=1 Tax=Sphingobacterium humi TaxID=1796905 RepID=A0A6N8L0R3_9SPHI|nr:hypothetical protein [Sphingobacterium humi]MVZ62081.1 hypothetical protein [Sphingobacterium humi]
MESKKEKDIIAHIVKTMKDKEELPYREGAWEHFRDTQLPPVRKKTAMYYWAASAAAAILVAFFAVKHKLDQQALAPTYTQVETKPTTASPQSPQPLPVTAGEEPATGAAEGLPTLGSNQMAMLSSAAAPFASQSGDPFVNDKLALSAMSQAGISYTQAPYAVPRLTAKQPQVQALVLDDTYRMAPSAGTKEVLAYQGDQFAVQAAGAEQQLGNKKFNFSERFDLGLFVSPNTTNERMNVGAGMLVGFNINKNLSVRTGLAYNQYEVGLMKDPIGAPETQVLASSDVLEQDAKYSMMATQANRTLILPNVNAVSGNVQAFEVPLEVKYKSNAGYYASSGLSYAVVLNQNRYTHFIENANSDLFDKGLPNSKEELQHATKAVTRKVKTAEENVNSNNFGGFINLSIGKEMKMNRRLNLSVEPFVKLPVGSFKQADMNYTNGGIRIITQF